MEVGVLVEENNQRSSSTPVSNPLGSIVRIDAISIELAGVMENNYEANKCEHFSIRGYAAEMRRKDMNVCFPFPFDANPNKLEEKTNMLPPLHVAKFRWWGCKNCLWEIGATSGAEEIGITCGHYQSGVLSRSTCPHILPSATAMVLSDSHISPDLDTLSGRKTNGGDSTAKDEIHLSPCDYNKGKKHEVELAAVLGRGTVARDDENPVHDLTSNPCFILDRHVDGPDAHVSKIHDFVEFCAPSFRTHTSADLENPERTVKNSDGIHQMGTLDSSDCQQRMTSIALPGIKFFKGKTRKRPLDLEENDILDKICHGDKHMDSPSSSLRQGTQKVRLLTELLGSKSAHNTFMPNSEMKAHSRSSPSPQQSEGKTIMSKKKKKHVGAWKTSLVPKRPSVPGESSIMKKCLGIMETELSAPVSNAGKGHDLSLKSYMVAHQNEKGGIPTNGDGIDLLLHPRKDTVREDTQHKNAIMHIGESDQFFRKGLLCDLKENIAANRTSPFREIQTLAPRVANGTFSRHQHLDFFSTRGTEEVQEQGNDDIPMEIVELLARNQYERYCQETERNFFFLKQAKDKRDAELNCFCGVHGNGMVKSSQENKCRVTSPVSGVGTVTTDENVGMMKQNQSIFFSDSHGNHLSFGKPVENSAFTGFSAFAKNKEKQTGGVQICDFGPSRYSRPQNCKWTGMRQSEEAGKNHMAFDFNIPQMHASQSSNFGFHSQFPKPSREGTRTIGDHDLNFMKPNANGLDKGKKISNSEFQRESTEYPFVDNCRGFDLNKKVSGSLDLNSNETIPAMQLLSLMDAGVQSTSAFGIDGSPKFFRKPFCPNHLKVLDKPQFSCDHQKRGTGSYKDCSRNPPAFYGKNIPEKYFECPPVVPAVSAFVSPFQNEGNLKRVVGFPKSEERGKLLVQSTGRKLQKPASTSGGTVFSMRSISNNEICTLNRNPADFSAPEAGNVYMASIKGLKFQKTGYFNGGSGLNNRDGRKRRRVTKLN